MLRSIKNTFGYPVEALDGNLGKVKDTLFDDNHWSIRYLVIDTARWLPGRKVLIRPHQAKQPQLGWQGNRFPVELTKDQIENAPELDEHSPVSRQYEQEYARYYRQNHPYWAGPYAWGFAHEPLFSSTASDSEEEVANIVEQDHIAQLESISENHLHSASEVIGYRIDAEDDHFGHVEDFIFDDEKWKIQYMVIDTKNWLPGKKSLIDLSWVDLFNWSENSAVVSLTRKQIENAPEFDHTAPVNREYEKNLYDYYGRPYHWRETHAVLPPL